MVVPVIGRKPPPRRSPSTVPSPPASRPLYPPLPQSARSFLDYNPAPPVGRSYTGGSYGTPDIAAALGTLGPGQDAQALVDRILAAQRAQVQADYQQRLAQAQADAQRVQAIYAGAAQAIQSLGLGEAAQGAYHSAASADAAFGKGFSDAMREVLGESGGQINEALAAVGAPEGQRIGPGSAEAAGNVLYGLGGFIPARTLEQQGVSAYEQYAGVPAATAGIGAFYAAGQLAKAQQELSDWYSGQLGQITASQPQTLLQIQGQLDQRQASAESRAISLYNAGILTQRDLARQLGLPNPQSYPATAKAAGAPSLRYYKDAAGNQWVLNEQTGRASRLPGEARTGGAPTLRIVRTANGAQVAVDPTTGRVIRQISPPGKTVSATKTVRIGNRVYRVSGTTLIPLDVQGAQLPPTVVRQPSPAAISRAWKAINESKNPYWALRASPEQPLSTSEIRQVLKDYNKTHGENLTVADLPTLSQDRRVAVGLGRYQTDPQDVYLNLVHSGIPARRAWTMVRKVYPSWGEGYFNPKGEAAQGAAYSPSRARSQQQPVSSTDWPAMIRSAASYYGVDPEAVLAVTRAEGLSGGVGDYGTSFGPFQLHIGGALPSGRGQSWAESPAGLDYALRQIAQVARGKRGRAAIEAIVRRFERPRDPEEEITRALGYYLGNQYV